jgi:hypothetical protein
MEDEVSTKVVNAQSRPLPSFFFKYTSRDTAKLTLQNGTLRWSTPTRFNDPYDLQFDLHIDAARETVRAQAIEKTWRAWTDQSYAPHPKNQLGQLLLAARRLGLLPSLSRNEFEKKFGPAMDESFDAAIAGLPRLHADFRTVMAKSKVLCQSEVPDSLLMWAYYAEQHQGAVLCFTADLVRDSAWHEATPVQYSPRMPRLFDEDLMADILAGVAMLDVKTLVDRVVYTKAAEWAHEREWRLEAGSGRNPDAPFEDVPFHPSELHGVIFGCVMPQAYRDDLTEIIRQRYSHAEIYTARKHDREFRLIIDEFPRRSSASD